MAGELDEIIRPLQSFCMEAIPLITENGLPFSKYRDHYLIEENRGEKLIKRSRTPELWEFTPPLSVFDLESYSDSMDTCENNELLKSRSGKFACILNRGLGFHASHVVINYLLEVINYNETLEYSDEAFDYIFDEFKKYISGDSINCTIIVPFDEISIDTHNMTLDDGLRIKQLSIEEVVKLVNQCPILARFYDSTLIPWFDSILEYDINLKWVWRDHDYFNKPQEHFNFQTLKYIEPDINKEIILMRSILNLSIGSPTYVMKYSGWESRSFLGGTINSLPWKRPNIWGRKRSESSICRNEEISI